MQNSIYNTGKEFQEYFEVNFSRTKFVKSARSSEHFLHVINLAYSLMSIGQAIVTFLFGIIRKIIKHLKISVHTCACQCIKEYYYLCTILHIPNVL